MVEAAVATGLEIADLDVHYYGRNEAALTGLSLTVAAGELVGLAGRNGAGKSTLALAAAGFIPRVVRARVSGAVRVAGHPLVGEGAPAHDGERVHRVGIVFSNPGNQLSATKVTVREELAFGLENLGVARSEMDTRIDAVMERLHIGHLADRSPFALSGGEQQRVAIASIVAMGMDTLVLDEPTAQLDPLSTAAVTDLLVELAHGGAAVLVTEHNSAVLGRTRRCLALEAGRSIVADLPAVALGSGGLGSVGLPVPTLVALAEAAGVEPVDAFSESAVAAALRVRPGAANAVAKPVDASTDAVAWDDLRAHPPTGIAVDHLVHTYPGGVEAVRDVTLHVDAGETVAIVGQNGSGKTTLVKHLNGLLRPDRGTVRIGGTDAASTPVHRLAGVVGFVFQDPDDQLFNRTVEREVRFGPRNLALPADTVDELVRRALEVVGLSGEATTNPYDLNVSARKLVALGSVLATDPAVLVLDEPTTGQDGPGVARVGAIVDGLRAAGRTVIAITHDMEFAARHFSRIVVMRDGGIIADGPPRQVFARALHDLLASTGLTPPPAARVAALLGLDDVPASADQMLALLARRWA